MRDGDGVEARDLTALVAAVLPRAWRRDSPGTAKRTGGAWRRPVSSSGPTADGTDPVVVLCFGLLHDTRRENETYDPGHGHRVPRRSRASFVPRGCSG